ncbi:LolA family protein [Peredibacter sp. HCB2-198]|uniref:LolA family protein n=1 Tax=Peredibacter sp. HCB2-198 TaxID=3383025 RepID=UPI0038B4A889
MKLLLGLLLLPTLSFASSFVPTSFSANYEETLKSVTGKERKSFGKIDYKFPGHLRFEVTQPNPTLFVVNPQKSWLFQPAFVKGEKDQVTIQKSSNLPIIKFLDSVKDGVEQSKLFTTKYNKNEVTLTFVKTIQKEMGFTEVVLQANKDAKSIKELKGFEKIILTKVDGSKTNIRLIDIKENVSFPPGNFEYKPSANAKITNQ